MKKNIRNFSITGVLLIIAIVFTLLVRFVDRKPIGPANSIIGLSGINVGFMSRINPDGFLYTISKVFGFVPFGLILIYLAIAIYQLIRTKSIKGINPNIIIAFCLYVLLGVCYLFFDKVLIINYRPVLSGVSLEPSYPSSHTMLAVVVCGTSLIINKSLYESKDFTKYKNAYWLIQVLVFLLGYSIILARTFSGVHWLTDIIGGILIGAFMVSLFYSLTKLKINKD